MKPITIIPTIETQHWKFFLNHHGISYNESEDVTIQNQIFVADCEWFAKLWTNNRSSLFDLLKSNQVLLVANTDSPVILKPELQWLRELDKEPEAKNLTFVLECAWFSHGFDNISVVYDPHSRFIDLIEQRATLRLNKTIDKNFLMIMGRSAPARDRLYAKLEHHAHDSIMMYHRSNHWQWPNHPGYIGEDSSPTQWQKSLVPSLDLYNRCAFEVSSETLTVEGSWFTEKTFRSIAAKTPLILMGVPGILKDLQNLGFKTFGDYVDESYDLIDNEMDRVNRVAETVNDIVCNGSVDFAQSVEHITEHNWNRLVELKGLFQIDKDQRFFTILESLSLSPR